MCDKDEDKDSCNCSCIDAMHSFWEKYKYKVSTPVAITLSALGVICGVLIPQYHVIGGVAVVVTNVSIFFTGVTLSQFSVENKALIDDNVSLKNENRRLTVAPKLINLGNTGEPCDSETPRSIDTIGPVDFAQLHKNNIVQSSINSFLFPQE